MTEQHTTEQHTAKQPTKRVLIVDDEQDFTSMLRLNLEQACNYEVREENNALRAVETAKAFRPDIIFLDVMMPEADGGDVAFHLRGDPATRDIPVVFLTALVGGEDPAVGGLVSGGYRFLPKPLDLDEVIACVESPQTGPRQTALPR